ncbi:MAG: DUF2892 domain-containing protein [Candidatus Margulisiibacteriota bacterium]|jgi:hypothetical protein
MKCNVGKIDQIIRVLAGIVLIAWGAYAKNWWGAVGLIPLATGLLRSCPLYMPFKFSSCDCCKTEVKK